VLERLQQSSSVGIDAGQGFLSEGQQLYVPNGYGQAIRPWRFGQFLQCVLSCLYTSSEEPPLSKFQQLLGHRLPEKLRRNTVFHARIIFMRPETILH